MTTVFRYQTIALVSKKFSKQSQRWATIKQEAFGIYYTVKHLAYYLVGKNFVVETDHNNLVWIRASMVPKIMRGGVFICNPLIFKSDACLVPKIVWRIGCHVSSKSLFSQVTFLALRLANQCLMLSLMRKMLSTCATLWILISEMIENGSNNLYLRKNIYVKFIILEWDTWEVVLRGLD